MTKKFLVYGMLALLVSMSSCSNDSGEEQGIQEGDLKPIPQVMTRAQQTDFSRVSNVFANKLFGVLASQPSAEGKNVCVAPMSMQYALSILANGAVDPVQQQMVQAMGFESITHLNAENHSLLEKLSEDDDYVKVAFANSIWLDNVWSTPLPEYKSLIENTYDATVNMADFESDLNAVQQQVNAWAKDKTNNYISQVPLDLHLDSRMAAVNVCNFDGKWAKPFDPQSTYDGSFANYDGTVSSVKLMLACYDEKFAGCEDENAKMIELPYGQGYYTMMLVMPNNPEQLDEMIANADWWAWHEKMAQKWSEIAMPRFAVASDWADVDKLLPSLGMPEKLAITFDKILSAEIQMQKLVQSVVLKVDENGTKVSSASSSMNDFAISDLSGRITINKPFIFAIRENTTGAILFMGKVVKL